MRGSRRAILRAHARPVTVIREETHPLQSDSRSGPQFVCTGDGAQPHAGARDSSEARCDPTLNGRELAVAAYLGDHVIPALIGRDAHRIEDTWQYLYRGAYWRRGPVTMCAIAAVDTALWDIKAKAAELPLYQLLGGQSR